MKRTIPVILTILIVVGCFIGYRYKKDIEKEHEAGLLKMSEEYNKLLKELRQQKEELNKDIETLKQETTVRGMGSTIVLLTDTNIKCLDDVVPMLDEYNYHGVIAIDDNHSPLDNLSDYLNIDDINNLVNKGYEVVLTVNNTSDVVALNNKYTNAGLTVCGFYYPNDDATLNQINSIKNMNIDVVITYLDNVDNTDIISILSIGSIDQNSKNAFESSIENSSIMAFGVGYERISEKYNHENLESMLKVMNASVLENETNIVNISEAKQRYNAYLDYLVGSSQDEKYQKIAELEKQLKETEERLAQY